MGDRLVSGRWNRSTTESEYCSSDVTGTVLYFVLWNCRNEPTIVPIYNNLLGRPDEKMRVSRISETSSFEGEEVLEVLLFSSLQETRVWLCFEEA
uniref:Uncharacterized protein n=1 Tax=Fagus sylvatica TaxID=28930 RepID=A0A2N9I686_FAGSY